MDNSLHVNTINNLFIDVYQSLHQKWLDYLCKCSMWFMPVNFKWSESNLMAVRNVCSQKSWSVITPTPNTYWAHSKKYQNKPCSQCCIKEARYITLSNLKGGYITTRCRWLIHRLSVAAPDMLTGDWQSCTSDSHTRQPDDRKISKCPAMIRRRKPQLYTLTLISIDKFRKWIDNNFIYYLMSLQWKLYIGTLTSNKIYFSISIYECDEIVLKQLSAWQTE